MGYKATKTTYAVDAAGARRLVSEGDLVPSGYEPETKSDVEETDEVAVDGIVGYRNEEEE